MTRQRAKGGARHDGVTAHGEMVNTDRNDDPAGSGSDGAGPDDDADFFDRRRARGTRTRLAIVESLIALVEDGRDPVDAQRLAQRARVAERTVHNHFERVGDIYLEAAMLQISRYRDLVAIIPSRGPLHVRIDTTCRHRKHYFEAISPVLNVAWRRIPEVRDWKIALADHHGLLRRQLSTAFAPEIEDRGTGAQLLLDTLDTATGWHNWFILRVEQGISPKKAEEMMALTLGSLLGMSSTGLPPPTMA